MIAPVTTTAWHTRLLTLNQDSDQNFIAVTNYSSIYHIYKQFIASVLRFPLTYLTPMQAWKTKELWDQEINNSLISIIME
jgi:hypothetical protein